MLPFDLHVLGMPPAFNLSQDQTLQFNPTLAYLLALLLISTQALNLSKRPHSLSSLSFLINPSHRRDAYSTHLSLLVNGFL